MKLDEYMHKNKLSANRLREPTNHSQAELKRRIENPEEFTVGDIINISGWANLDVLELFRTLYETVTGVVLIPTAHELFKLNHYSVPQKLEMLDGERSGVDIRLFADPANPWHVMRDIRVGLERKAREEKRAEELKRKLKEQKEQ